MACLATIDLNEGNYANPLHAVLGALKIELLIS